MIRELWDNPNIVRFRYYAMNTCKCLLPALYYRYRRSALDELLKRCTDGQVLERARYYNQLAGAFTLPADVVPFRMNLLAGRSAYQYDLMAVLRYFPRDVRVAIKFGDNRDIPDVPTVVKSRPVGTGNANAVLLNLNKVRHFYFVRDRLPFREKRGMLVWRGRANQEHRKAFLEKYYHHPLCDVGHYHPRHQDVVWTKPKLSVREQLGYKYILAIEGNDVATNLKWILFSNSLCFMTKPRFETWFMEGRLVAGQHYVQLRDDYSDLEEKIAYYNSHPEEAEEIVRAANLWVAQFLDPMRERLIGILVLWRYLYLSGQSDSVPPCG
jgi:hypothetical protein